MIGQLWSSFCSLLLIIFVLLFNHLNSFISFNKLFDNLISFLVVSFDKEIHYLDYFVVYEDWFDSFMTTLLYFSVIMFITAISHCIDKYLRILCGWILNYLQWLGPIKVSASISSDRSGPLGLFSFSLQLTMMVPHPGSLS